jgi:RimJ/RimL family protein N-acetyltransferase
MRNIWRSQRLVFRPAEDSDEQFLASLHQYDSDTLQNARHILPVPQGKASATRHREALQRALLGCIVYIPGPAKPDAPTTSGSDAISDNIPIGTILLSASDPQRSHHRDTSVALTIAHPYQRQGYGAEAILWVLEWAFQHANMHRVSIGAFAYNEGAVRLYQRLGFVLEGSKRESAWYDGKYHDTIEMGMLRDEWRKLYGKAA